jgi:hypothetical protein
MVAGAIPAAAVPLERRPSAGPDAARIAVAPRRALGADAC